MNDDANDAPPQKTPPRVVSRGFGPHTDLPFMAIVIVLAAIAGWLLARYTGR